MNFAYAVKMLTSTDQQTKMQKNCAEDILMHLSVWALIKPGRNGVAT